MKMPKAPYNKMADTVQNHSLVVAGAQHLHAQGHISTAQRDQIQGAARAHIARHKRAKLAKAPKLHKPKMPGMKPPAMAGGAGAFGALGMPGGMPGGMAPLPGPMAPMPRDDDGDHEYR